MYQAIYEKYNRLFWWNPILMLWENFNVLAEYDSIQWPEHIPLANNWEREDICEAYTPEQVITMFEIVYQHILTQDRFKRSHLKKELSKHLKWKWYRKDSYEAMINKQFLIPSNIKHVLSSIPKYAYNPAMLYNIHLIEQDEIPLVFIPSKKFFNDNQNILSKEYYKDSRNFKWYTINKKAWLEWSPTEIDVDDIESINTLMYWPITWSTIIEGDFKSLVLE